MKNTYAPQPEQTGLCNLVRRADDGDETLVAILPKPFVELFLHKGWLYYQQEGNAVLSQAGEAAFAGVQFMPAGPELAKMRLAGNVKEVEYHAGGIRVDGERITVDGVTMPMVTRLCIDLDWGHGRFNYSLEGFADPRLNGQGQPEPQQAPPSTPPPKKTPPDWAEVCCEGVVGTVHFNPQRNILLASWEDGLTQTVCQAGWDKYLCSSDVEGVVEIFLVHQRGDFLYKQAAAKPVPEKSGLHQRDTATLKLLLPILHKHLSRVCETKFEENRSGESSLDFFRRTMLNQ